MDPAHSPSASERLARRKLLAEWEEFFRPLEYQWREVVADGRALGNASGGAGQGSVGGDAAVVPAQGEFRDAEEHATRRSPPAWLTWGCQSGGNHRRPAPHSRHRNTGRYGSVATSSPAEGTPRAVRQGQWSVARYAADLEDMAFWYGWPASPADVFVEGLHPRIRGLMLGCDGIIVNQNLIGEEFFSLNGFNAFSPSSFVRQLNLHGFKRLARYKREPNIHHYFHRNFKRNRPELLPLVRRCSPRSKSGVSK
ncbi:unnamed protein product [Tetraodon nigroviridis]|uniref:(spotted green pufferfish) hypothetical protein n=1 Tax=Tetraodon nigroviridis TaxID=99883 RepID=Q4RF67_TETNG|nr:unnamed protein product [Tetraodon nigroviridis]